MAWKLIVCSLYLATASPSTPRRAVPEFNINLDLDPEERFTEVLQHFKSPLQRFVQHLHGNNVAVKLLLAEMVKRRGPENAELQGEIQNAARILGVTDAEVHALQMFYELYLVNVPIVNFTTYKRDLSVNEMADLFLSLVTNHIRQEAFPPMHVGCTGIVALDDADGTVYHARNLDFSLTKYLQAMTYTGIFMKKGVEIFRAQTIAGYSAILTGLRKGPDGFGIEINSRFGDHVGAYRQYLHNLFTEKRAISGWTKRKVLENIDNYDDAVEALSTTPYPASEYNVVSGVKKGVVLARNPDGLAYKLPLNESSKKYVIMTNFDYVWHDFRENFDDTTVKGLFHPRRKAAEKLLDAANVITPEVLFQVMNDDAVMAKDTMFQVIMNVETGLWNASLPACVKCGNDANDAYIVV